MVKVLNDYHIHTVMSKDAKGELEEYIETAREKGLTEIGVSDHFHLEEATSPSNPTKLIEYAKRVQTLRERTSFPVKLGIEADYIPTQEDETAKMLKTVHFDYVIGSVHFIDGWTFDNPKYLSEYQKWNIPKLYETYFDLIQRSAKSRLFDFIGHLDLIKKFGYKPKTDITDILLRTVEVLKECKICVEVNTGGLRAPCREIYPAKALLKMCFDQAVPITLGSDAHQPKDVGKDFDKALKLIKEVGYESITRFTRRKPEQVKI